MNKNKIKHFFFTNYYGMLISLSLVIGVFVYFCSSIGLQEYIYSKVWIIQLITMFIALVSHAVTAIGLNSKLELHFFSMAGMGIRFFLSLIFIFIAVFVLKSELVAFVLNFFILYLLYTSFEIYYLLRNLRPDSKKEGTLS